MVIFALIIHFNWLNLYLEMGCMKLLNEITIMMNFKNLILVAMSALCLAPAAQAEHVTIIAVNDTHSQIDPASDGKGGALLRRAIYDKVRSENKYTMTLHAGDAVQGNVYFSLYGGAVEYAAIDSLGYDAVIWGNHEMDNGIDSTFHFYKNVKAQLLSANYDFSNTKMDGIVKPYMIKTYGDKRVAVIGINVCPEGIISEKNFKGLHYLPSIDVADATAKYLKEVQKVDYVVMLSHIGYFSEAPNEPNDCDIVKASHYIDLVVGGHSHSTIKPGSPEATVLNADGKPITIGQNGKFGKIVATYDLDLETGAVTYKHIPVDSSWDEAAKKYVAMDNWLKPYRHGVDSLMTYPVGESAKAMKNSSAALQNWTCDASLDIIRKISGVKKVDCCIMNKGGIRINMPAGMVSEGVIGSMFPFDNRYVVLEMTGKDLIDALKVMAHRHGDAVSKELFATFNAKGELLSSKLNGKNIDPKKVYNVATIDYLANGGDYMEPFKTAKRLWVDNVKYGEHVLQYVKDLKAAGKVIDAKDEWRMVKK